MTLQKHIRRFTCVIFLLMLLTPALAHEFRHGPWLIAHPWARATAPGAKMGVVYFSVSAAPALTPADAPKPATTLALKDVLLAVSVGKSVAAKASLHSMSVDAKGMMQMALLSQGVPIDANTAAVFAPGGKHVMLEGLVKPLVAGQQFSLTLKFAKAGAVSVIVNVE
jgi:periplasmic copper chaperone A